jgi:hypothetical protein
MEVDRTGCVCRSQVSEFASRAGHKGLISCSSCRRFVPCIQISRMMVVSRDRRELREFHNPPFGAIRTPPSTG